MRQQPGQQRLMYRFTIVICGDAITGQPTKILCHLFQLLHQITPLSNAHIVQKFLLHATTKSITAQLTASA